MEQTRQAQVYGVRPARTFEQAAAKFVLENQHKRSIADDVSRLKDLMPFIGSMHARPAPYRHPAALDRSQAKARVERPAPSIMGCKIVRRILNLAAGEWVDEQGLTWLQAPPKIKLLPNTDKRQPYPLSWEEQSRLFRELPAHLGGYGAVRGQHGLP